MQHQPPASSRGMVNDNRSSAPRHVAIIGGGLAGLTCGYALQRRGIDAVVFEAAARPGGRDAAALFLLSRDLFRNTFELIRDLGLSGEVVPIPPNTGQVYKGRIRRHRVASAAGLLKFEGLNIADKALLARMAYLLTRLGPQLDFHQPERGLDLDDETVASFVKRELSQNILNYVAGPLISTLFFYGSEETSRLLYLILAKQMFNTSMSTLRGGLERISGLLSEQVRVVTDRHVRLLAGDGTGYTVNGDAGDRFSDVVLAVPGDAVLGIEGMAGLLSGEDQEFFRGCRYQRVVTALVETGHAVEDSCYAVSIPRVEKLTAAAILFYDYIDPSRAADGRRLLAVTGGGPGVRPETLLEDLQKLYPVQVRAQKALEWRSGMPMFPPGRYRQIASFQKRERRPGLFFCGDYLLGPFVEAAITTGLKAAGAIQNGKPGTGGRTASSDKRSRK